MKMLQRIESCFIILYGLKKNDIGVKLIDGSKSLLTVACLPTSFTSGAACNMSFDW